MGSTITLSPSWSWSWARELTGRRTSFLGPQLCSRLGQDGHFHMKVTRSPRGDYSERTAVVSRVVRALPPLTLLTGFPTTDDKQAKVRARASLELQPHGATVGDGDPCPSLIIPGTRVAGGWRRRNCPIHVSSQRLQTPRPSLHHHRTPSSLFLYSSPSLSLRIYLHCFLCSLSSHHLLNSLPLNCKPQDAVRRLHFHHTMGVLSLLPAEYIFVETWLKRSFVR